MRNPVACLTLAAGSLSIQCTNSEQEEAEEELEIAHQGALLEIGFKINYLTDVLTNLQVEHRNWRLATPTAARCSPCPSRRISGHIVMPMRI